MDTVTAIKYKFLVMLSEPT